MARVTVEDCAEVVPSRFELVALASQRAKYISSGGEITISRDNDKNAVIALREIAEKTVNAESLRESLIKSKQSRVNVDKYGVEEIKDEAASEVENEISAMQEEINSSSANDESLLYGDEMTDVDD